MLPYRLNRPARANLSAIRKTRRRLSKLKSQISDSVRVTWRKSHSDFDGSWLWKIFSLRAGIIRLPRKFSSRHSGGRGYSANLDTSYETPPSVASRHLPRIHPAA